MKLTLLLASSSVYLIARMAGFHPDLQLIMWLSAAMVVDLATGIMKSIILKRVRTSSGLQRTIVKFLRYFGSIFIAFMLQNILPEKELTVPVINSQVHVEDLTKWMIFYLIYIEVLSILENIIQCDTTDRLSNGPLIWIHNLLSFKFRGMGQKQTITDANKNGL